MNSKFINDTEIGGIVESEDGCQELQRDHDQLCKCIEEWQMEFNSDKDWVLHFGKSNQSK